MKICRFVSGDTSPRVGLVVEEKFLIDLSDTGIRTLEDLTETDDVIERLAALDQSHLPRLPLSDVRLCAPVENQEVWAAGVTYQRSKQARMEESDFSASAYDRVYDASRPELFFKSLGTKVVAHGESVGIRKDSKWNVPEPELALVINSKGKIVACTIGNDMSSRDIEGENLLYLPQAKIYEGSCALGPVLLFGSSEAAVRDWSIEIEISRESQTVFTGQTSLAKIKRGFQELMDYLFRSQHFPHGVVLLTGTGIVPPDDFTLGAEDVVTITVAAIGSLRNRVRLV
jgi:2-dehydro-3-deoxy-D-arabinonate dehydratase